MPSQFALFTRDSIVNYTFSENCLFSYVQYSVRGKFLSECLRDVEVEIRSYTFKGRTEYARNWDVLLLLEFVRTTRRSCRNDSNNYFFFWFRFWAFKSHRHVVFHWHTKFHRNRIIIISDFSDGGHQPCWICSKVTDRLPAICNWKSQLDSQIST